MKSLRLLAALPLVAVTSHAYTFDIQLGYGKPNAPIENGQKPVDNTAIVGIAIGDYISDSSHVALNISTRDIVTPDPIDAAARTAHIDYTYEFNSTGGIKPFIGAGVGYAFLKNTESSSALSTNVFGGFRFEISESLDFTLTARLLQIYSVDFAPVAGEQNRQVNVFEGLAGLRFHF